MNQPKRDEKGQFAKMAFDIRKDSMYGLRKPDSWMDRNAHLLKPAAFTTAAAYGAYHLAGQQHHLIQAVTDHLTRLFGGQDWAILGVHGHKQGGHAGRGR